METILVADMIRGGFLDPAIRADLIGLVRDGKAETRLTRRANALLLLPGQIVCYLQIAADTNSSRPVVTLSLMGYTSSFGAQKEKTP